MIYILMLIIIVIFSLFFYEIYKTFENEIAHTAYRIKKNQLLINWLVFICDILINASQGIITVCLTALAFAFSASVGLVSNLSDNDIINSNLGVLIFLGIYGILVSTIFWYIKQKIKGLI